MKKQFFNKIKSATNPDIPLHNVKKIINKKLFSSILYSVVPNIQGKYNCVVLKTHPCVCMHACAHTHMHTHLPRKLIFQKRNLFLNTWVFQARKLIIPRPDPFLQLPKKKRESYLNFVWIHLSLKIFQRNLRWGWKLMYLSLLLDSFFIFLFVGKKVKNYSWAINTDVLCCHFVRCLLCFAPRHRISSCFLDSISSIRKE